MSKRKVLVLCTQNSARSQMAEGILRNIAGERFKVISAGVRPSNLNPYAVRALAEINIDISKQYSKNLTEFLGQKFDYVITVCDQAKGQCPVFPGSYQKIHWPLNDPAAVSGSDEEKLEAFRRARDELKALIFSFVKS